MAFDIVNSKRSKSVIRVTGNTATRINLNQLSVNTSIETITGASITHLTSSSDGKWIVSKWDCFIVSKWLFHVMNCFQKAARN